MIELHNNALFVSFPETHPGARLKIELQRTLRIPDDGNTYPLPAGLGAIELRHIDDYASQLPEPWVRRGGVIAPLHPSEALWVKLDSVGWPSCPFALKVAAGKRSAITGELWRAGLHADPLQDYVVVPDQPWLDGFVTGPDQIRQFVAMPLGDGYTVEEQLNGYAETGGLQLEAFPWRPELWAERRDQEQVRSRSMSQLPKEFESKASGLGLAPGGRMRQQVYQDSHGIEEWDAESSSRCFIHLVDARVWQALTGERPGRGAGQREYAANNIPWFDYTTDAPTVSRSQLLAGVASINALQRQKGMECEPDELSGPPSDVIYLRKEPTSGTLRGGEW